MIIAIDGLTAAGKGTLAKRLAASLGFHHLDTGLIYRAVGAKLLAGGADPADAARAEAAARALEPADLRREGLRSEAASRAASIVAAIPGVRAALVEFQRRFARQAPGAVLDGRDIGTVICPDATVKLFVTASPEIRARRRFDELQARGESATYPAVFRDLQERDARDQARGTAPAKPAEDAIVLDTSALTADQVFDRALEIVRSRR
ncbi:MAG: (d)CMP kinase [Alphaproteobacteria bacterium]|nr:(d)CMP kinase [Alphaproteobacteria bacterium]